jgi:hypothetical protein
LATAPGGLAINLNGDEVALILNILASPRPSRGMAHLSSCVLRAAARRALNR